MYKAGGIYNAAETLQLPWVCAHVCLQIFIGNHRIII